MNDDGEWLPFISYMYDHRAIRYIILNITEDYKAYRDAYVCVSREIYDKFYDLFIRPNDRVGLFCKLYYTVNDKITKENLKIVIKKNPEIERMCKLIKTDSRNTWFQIHSGCPVLLEDIRNVVNKIIDKIISAPTKKVDDIL